MRANAWFLIAALAGIGGRVAAQEEPPDLSFLEYLGSWGEGDEEWLVIAGVEGETQEPDELDQRDQHDEHDEASDADEEKDGKQEQD